jgi:mono/diheme cytochrome c family protein
MDRNRSLGRLITNALAALAIMQAAWLAYPAVRARVLGLEETAAVRGQRLAARLGCFSCHGPQGTGGTPNPGSREDTVPAFTERTQMMYAKTVADLREYVLDGAPRHRREDPAYRARMEAAALRMPAYRGHVSDAELDDLIAYLRAVSGLIGPGEEPDEELASRGAELAEELGCFACHGPLGAGGVLNPGSFKGYIPGFWAADFDDLVRSDHELRGWITDGKIPRIAEHPMGRRWLERQLIKMPAYGRFLPREDVDAVVAYVRWLRAGTWRPLLR